MLAPGACALRLDFMNSAHTTCTVHTYEYIQLRLTADFLVDFSDRFQTSKEDCTIWNFHAKDFGNFQRHSGRIQLAYFIFENYILTSFESKKRRRTEVIHNSDDFHVDVDEFLVPKVNVPNVIFNFDTLFRRNQPHTFPSASFVFFGILEQGFLCILAFQPVQGVNIFVQRMIPRPTINQSSGKQ
jgi:hypothetical protein